MQLTSYILAYSHLWLCRGENITTLVQTSQLLFLWVYAHGEMLVEISCGYMYQTVCIHIIAEYFQVVYEGVGLTVVCMVVNHIHPFPSQDHAQLFVPFHQLQVDNIIYYIVNIFVIK